MPESFEQMFTRQQVAKLIGVSDDMLAYWLKQGLLVPTSGGDGRGSHRRFDFVQVNIAAVYRELRRFGVNVGALRSLAELLQGAAKLGATYNLHPSNYSTAANLANKLRQFRNGEAVLIPRHKHGDDPPPGLRGRARSDWRMQDRSAETEDEVVEHVVGQWSDYDPVTAILAAAEGMGPNRDTEAHVYADLVSEARAPGYSGAYSWLLALEPGEPCRIEFGFDGAKFFDTISAGSPEDFGSGIFIPVSGIFRRIWDMKSPDDYARERAQWRLERDRQQITDLLSAAGIIAIVTVHEDEEQGLSIDHAGTDRSAVEAALRGTRYALGSEEGQA